jgi:hypothetical protein
MLGTSLAGALAAKCAAFLARNRTQNREEVGDVEYQAGGGWRA